MDAETSMTFRSVDRRLYAALGCYVAICFVLVVAAMEPRITPSPFAIIDLTLILGTAFPGIAILALIIFQVEASPRPSPLAFCLVLLGLGLTAMVMLNIAYAASASV